MTGLIIPRLLQKTIHFSGTLSCRVTRESWIGKVVVIQHTVMKVWMGLPLSKAHLGLLCVLNTEKAGGEEEGVTQEAHTKHCKSPVSSLSSTHCVSMEKTQIFTLVSNGVTPLTLVQSCSENEKLGLFSGIPGLCRTLAASAVLSTLLQASPAL